MNISGVVVATQPLDITQVSRDLEALAGVEVHGASKMGKLVVTVESEHAGTMAETVTHIQNLRGVISASMIYHHHEESAENKQEQQQ